VDALATISEAAATGAWVGATSAFLAERREVMADWLLDGTVYGGVAGLGLVLEALT
jgi:hypothetical protein